MRQILGRRVDAPSQVLDWVPMTHSDEIARLQQNCDLTADATKPPHQYSPNWPEVVETPSKSDRRRGKHEDT
jgi:hypothetical protein